MHARTREDAHARTHIRTRREFKLPLMLQSNVNTLVSDGLAHCLVCEVICTHAWWWDDRTPARTDRLADTRPLGRTCARARVRRTCAHVRADARTDARMDIRTAFTDGRMRAFTEECPVRTCRRTADARPPCLPARTGTVLGCIAR